MRIIIEDKRHLQSAAKKLLEHTKGKRILAFYGSMGAGKTTIIKAVCRVLDATDLISSPTFTLVNEYNTLKGDTLYHMDFYRIKKTEEVYDFGIEEYFASGEYCLLEWPELIEEILPAETVKIRITVGEQEQRILDLP